MTRYSVDGKQETGNELYKIKTLVSLPSPEIISAFPVFQIYLSVVLSECKAS